MVPDSRTSTISGFQENGAARPSKKGCQPATTAALPRSVPRRLMKTASSATYITNARESRAASVWAKALSASKTCRASGCRFCAWAWAPAGKRRSERGTRVGRRMTPSSSGGGGGACAQVALRKPAGSSSPRSARPRATQPRIRDRAPASGWQPAASGSSLACPNPQGSLRAITARQLKRLLGSSFANEAPSPNAEPDAHSEDERVTGEEPLPVDYLKDVRDGDNGEQDASGNQVGSHGVPQWSRACARRSHRQTGPSSGSTTSPTKWNPHLARTRVDALYAGSVCARTRRTRSLANANATSAVAASVAKPRPSNAGTMP